MQDAFARAFRVFIFALLCVWSCICSAGVSFVYDDLGRVTQAVYTDGSVVQYRYDANGNILEIIRRASSSLSISNVAPIVARVGGVLTISGTGFDASPSANAVTVGGVAAIVTSATTTELMLTVPSGAQTGSVTVTVAQDTATSPQIVTIARPVITSFTPAVVGAGGQVTVNGTYLNLVPTGTVFTVGGTPAGLVSLSANKAVITAPATGNGPIKISTSYGEATSAGSLIVAPGSIGAGNIVSSATASVGGATASLNINQTGRYGAISVRATANEFVTLQVNSLAVTPSANVNYTVYNPAGQVVFTGTLSGASRSIHFPRIPATGTYMVLFASGSSTVQLGATLESDTWMNAAGSNAAFSTPVPGQSKRAIFTATAGASYNLAATDVVMTPSAPGNWFYIRVLNPDGTNWVANAYGCNAPSCRQTLFKLPQTGDYSVIFYPNQSQQFSFTAHLHPSVTGTLVPGTPFTVNLTELGQSAVLKFTLAQAQTMALFMSSVTSVPANTGVEMGLYNPSGNRINWTGTTPYGATLDQPSLPAGEYGAGAAGRGDDGRPAGLAP